jgi:putative transposase
LSLRTKRPRRRKAAATRLDRASLTGSKQHWSMDFVSDTLFDGRRFRGLTIVDNFTRECLAIEVAQNLRGEEVATVLEKLRISRAIPARIQVDNGPEFISMTLDRFCLRSWHHAGLRLSWRAYR